MPQWAGSSWYYLRYVDNKNDAQIISKEKSKKYLPIDMYIGGVEHAVLHLLYSRFYTKFLKDIGVIDFDEPFIKLFNQGMITGSGGEKMSKSKGNVVSPDDLVNNYGCDSLRMYELFVGPPELDAMWNDRGIDGVYRFLNKLWNIITVSIDNTGEENKEISVIVNRLIKDVTDRLESFSLNTIISCFMSATNDLSKLINNGIYLDKKAIDTILILISPFTPHFAEELWQLNGGKESIFYSIWPIVDERFLEVNTLIIPIQINGKIKGTIEIDANLDEKEVLELAKENVKNKIKGDIVKEIYIPKKIVNIVVKG